MNSMGIAIDIAILQEQFIQIIHDFKGLKHEIIEILNLCGYLKLFLFMTKTLLNIGISNIN